ncbi:hypothetical protein [Acrocarpospora catenulata]|uniref:hypothetical protein n=1 Tax=Acrocarpospora catenulata TaxID=2836182 RepID=UPI001BDB4B9F
MLNLALCSGQGYDAVLAATRGRLGSATPGKSAPTALLVLAYLRKGETFTEVEEGFGASVATAWRYDGDGLIQGVKARTVS